MVLSAATRQRAQDAAERARAARAAPSVPAAAQVGASSPAGQWASLIGNPVGPGSNFGGPGGSFGNSTMGYLGNQGSQLNYQIPTFPQQQGGVQPPQGQAGQPVVQQGADNAGGMRMFPQQQGQNQEQQFDPRIGMAKLLETMKAIQPPTFAEGMQGAMDTIGGQLNRNASAVTRDREVQDYLNNAAAERASRENMYTQGLGAMTGRDTEQYVAGQERVQAPDRIGDITIGPRRLPGGYTNQDVMGTRLVPVQQAPAQAAAPQQNPFATTQDQSASNLYNQVAGAAAPAAFSQGGGIGGFQFAGPGGQFGGATMPTAPWAGGQPGTADAGIDTTGGQIWGPQHHQEAIDRLSSVSNATAPYMGTNADPAVQGGLQQQFGDFLQGAQSKTMNDLMRGGQQAQAGFSLESQVAGSRLQNALWQMMGQIYGSNLGTAGDQNALALRMQNALA